MCLDSSSGPADTLAWRRCRYHSRGHGRHSGLRFYKQADTDGKITQQLIDLH